MSLVDAVAGGADAGCVVSDKVRVVAGGADAGSVLSDEVRVVAGGAEVGSVVSAGVRALATVADCGRVSVRVSAVSSLRDDDVSRTSVAAVSDRRAVVDLRRSLLRNCRQVSELCSGLAALSLTAGFAPNALLVSSSSCPVMGSPLRI